MMSPIANYLPVFTAAGGVLAVRAAAYEVDPEPVSEETPAGVSAEEIERRIEEARTEVQAEAAAALEAALIEQGAELDARHAEALAEARRGWAEEQGAVMADMLKAGLEALETALADSLVHVLEPFFEAAMRAKAIGELREAVGDLLAHGQGAVVKVRGPADLVDPLREAFAGRIAMEFEPAETTDVTIESEDTTIRSQLQSWADTLRATLDEVR